MSQATLSTNWQGVVLSALIPLVVAAGFAYTALIPGWRPSESWVWGLFFLVPLEFIRAVMLAVLCVAYKDGRDPWDAAKTFLIITAVLTVLGLSYLVLEGGIDILGEITNPFVLKLLGVPIMIMLIDSIIGILTFSGDPREQANRLDALSEDSIDWLSLAIFRLPFVIATLYGLLYWANSEGLRFAAWVPAPSADLAIRAGLIYLAFYFVGKALIAAYLQTARYAQTGKRLLDVPWMQRVRSLGRGERRFERRDIEREASERYKYSEHPKSVLKFQEDLIRSLKEKADRSAGSGNK